MNMLTPLDAVPVPSVKPEEGHAIHVLGRKFAFPGLKALLGSADLSKAGDRNAGLAAPDEATREAARSVLSGLSLRYLHDHPLATDKGLVDEVMRVNYDIDREVFAEIADLSLGQVKNRLLSADAAGVKRLGRGLTGVMVAALAKLMDVHELIYAARKLKAGGATKARTLLGMPGTLSSRLQPNHPTDNMEGVTLLTYAGLSLGAGDALLGINPAVDTVENVSGLLHLLDKLRRQTGVPTQICVLSHIKTQLACLAEGAPVEILFQSLAGTSRTLTEEFDVTVALLDEGCKTMAERGALSPGAENWMYFETGQGSEYTYGKHEGIDMATTEALCYGLARRYDPFMVNNVTGFIGPETHLDNSEMTLSCLQDLFMGKMMGLPMGMAPCYTLHSQVTQEGQQMATELLTAAGANFFMDVHLSTDRMLAYFDTSAHDDQTLREIHGLKPAPDYLRWAVGRGIFAEDEDGSVRRGPRWGDPRQFCASDMDFQRLLEAVPAAYGFETAGPRPADQVSRLSRLNQAVAREATHAALEPEKLNEMDLRRLASRAHGRDEHLGHPELGGALDEVSLGALSPEDSEVQILITDGLSAEAVHHNIPDLLPVLMDGLKAGGVSFGQPILVPYGRVKLAEPLAEALDARLVINLIGERPGGDARASRSLSAYLALRLDDPEAQAEAAVFSGHSDIRFEYTVLSNIYDGGVPAVEAGSIIAEKAMEILRRKAAGNRLERKLAEIRQG